MMNLIKKIKFNRFSIIAIGLSFTLLLFFVVSYFNTFSDYITKGESKIEGDTVYINDLANDYYYYLGMNYVGDLNSNTVNYQESDLKAVTITYYGYPSDNPSLTGYVSLTEKQNKFVYYKYYPVKNNKLTIELIDNPFILRPVGKGFGGWESSNGTITKDNKTNTYTLTVNSNVTDIKVYAKWLDANVVFLKGEEGDDNFDGTSDYLAVASWGKAFELLRARATDEDDRELNIIVLTGDLNHSLNYTRPVTHTWDYTYEYIDNESYTEGEEYLIEYKNGNNRYAIRQNNNNVAVENLLTTAKPSDSALWIITHDDNGYSIKNKVSGSYLANELNNNDQANLLISNTPFYWKYDTDLRTFFTTYELNVMKYTFTLNDSIVDNNSFLIVDKASYIENNNNQSLNALNDSLANVNFDRTNYNETALWRITKSGDGLTIYNTHENKYLTYNMVDGTTTLALSNDPLVWNYDSVNHTLSTNDTRSIVTYAYSLEKIANGSNYIGYKNGDNYYLLDKTMNFVLQSANMEPSSDLLWDVTIDNNSLFLKNSENKYLRIDNGSLSLTDDETLRTAFNLNNDILQTVDNNYLYNNNGILAVTTDQTLATALNKVNVERSSMPLINRAIMYLNFNNNTWSLSNTGSEITFVSYERTRVDYKLSYDTTNNRFVISNSNTGTGLYFATYIEHREMTGTVRGSMGTNDSYTNTTNIAVTVTSMYDNTDYRNNATLTLTNNTYFRTTAYNDLQLENLKVDSVGYSSINDTNTTANLRNTYSSFVGNAKNVRIGRGMTPSSWTDDDSVIFAFLQGCTYNSSVGSSTNSNNAFKFVVESGRYSGLMASRIYNSYNGGGNYYNYYGSTYLTIGSDYDRATENNNLLDFYYRIGSSNYNGINGKSDVNDIAYLMNIKSGTIGMYYFDNNFDDSRGYSGIYVGGLSVNANNNNNDISSRIVVVEGGNIANINGGLRITESSGNNGVKTKIYVKNGNIQNIVGGAGVSTTYGDRYISVTGGNIAYSISGGSNGVAASDNNQQSGRLGGDSYVHVGGEAHIGTKGSGTLYDVNYGSVLGAGNGNQNFPNSGRVNTSHVYISGKAVIEGNVFGGGNFGPVYEDSNVQIDGGTINGNVYGGSNRSGVGQATVDESTIYDVSFDDDVALTSGKTYLINKINGTARNLLSENNNRNTYNVSLSTGTEPANYSQWLINSLDDGYTIRNVGRNDYLAYTTNNPPTLTMRDNTNNAIWNYDTTNKTFYRDISYVVSATVNYNFTRNITSGNEYIIVNTNANNANSINANPGNTQLSGTVEPTTNVWIFTASGDGYTIKNKVTGEYLGVTGNLFSLSLTTSDTPTEWTWNQNNGRLSVTTTGMFSRTYYLRYNNGWQLSTNSANLYLATYTANTVTNNAKYYLVFDNNTWKISTTPSSITLSNFTSIITTGYAVSNVSNGDVNITMNSGTVKGAIYGGSCETGTVAGTVTININGGDIEHDSNTEGSIFGGGYGEDTIIASGVKLNINDTKNVNIDKTIYGGSALGTIVGNVDIHSTDNSGNGTITVEGDFYCGSMGDSSIQTTGKIQGNCSLSIDGGTYKGSVYGENNANGSPTGVVTVTTGGNNTTTINNVYGGGNQANSAARSVTVNIENNSNITNAFGGANKASVSETNVNLHGGTVTNIYGGSNETGNITSSFITTTGGTATNIYGGNNLGGTTSTSNVNINGGTITSLFGGGNEATTGTSNINFNSGTVTNTYGGGNKAGITNNSNINLTGGNCTTMFGGSNESGDVPESNIVITGGTCQTIYGGNNLGGSTTTSKVKVNGGNTTNLFGGGNEAVTGTSNIEFNSGTVTNTYGGGNKAGITNNTNINLTGGNCTNMYGGSNESGDVPVSNITVTGGTCNTVYGGNNAGGTTVITNVTVNSGTLTNVYGGGNAANSTTTNVILNNSTNEISNIFGGCKEASAVTTNVTLNNGRANNVFGGSNTSGEITTSKVTVNDGTYQNVYGGNNDGGKTITATVTLLGGNSNTVFGGGNNAETDKATVVADNAQAGSIYGGGNNAAVNSDTDVTIKNGMKVTNNVFGGGNYGQVNGNTKVVVNTNSNVGNIYGGGNNAQVTGDTNVTLQNAKVQNNLFGGGNFGKVNGSTFVNITDAEILGSAYAGGNGNTATVNTNTTINVLGNTKVTNHVFGGGNAAETGSSANNTSMGVVNITGATIGGNVYGGANTSVLYGETVVNIGCEAVKTYTNDNSYQCNKIDIGGTVFGGGEANASGSEIYDFDFISVTKGIIINIDGKNHTDFDIHGSIFGSGNASSTSGYSRVYINNYGSDSDIKNNISLQRADVVVLNNSHISLSGATDRTNEYSTVVFSLSRVTELDLKNNSEIYLESGANLLTLFKSLNSDDTLAQVTIDEDDHSVTRTTNNRLYMHEDKILNIALNQNVTAYGEVDGMTFFGLYKRDRNGNIIRAMYDYNYETGDTPTENEMYYFASGSYVLGLHETNHDIKKDGFYTNYEDDNNPGHILVDYIQPTPEDAEHYMWIVGENIESYDIELIASKYSTLGTYEFPFINHTSGNTTFTIVGFNYDSLNPEVSLINPDDVPRVAETGTDADNTMGLAIKPGVGWINVGSSYFVTDSVNPHQGVSSYKSENSNVTPSFVFYLYHSKNLQTDGPMGKAVISLLVVTPIDDLTNKVKRINFNVTISRAIYDSNEYEAAMMPGRQYEMFSSSRMDITAKSSLSAYYSLYMESQQNIYRNGYHRVLTSNIMLPVNTKITMIDFASATKPEYYYYIVNSADNVALEQYYNDHDEVLYPLSNFVRMGSLDTTNKYDDAVANNIYYDETDARAIEEFIFIVDFKDTNITQDMSNCSLLIELVDNDNEVIRSVLGIQRDNMVYNIHANHEGVITAHANVSKPIVYPGADEDLRVTIDFNQNDVMSLNRIVDTTYYEQKMGIKVSFINELGNVVNGVDLMGTSLTLDGNTYYARSDGTIRFKIADRVVNSYSNIRINTTNSSLAAGEYTIQVDAFYSPDGIYYGVTPADTATTSFIMMNNSYGLDVTIPEEEIIIDKETGNNINGNKNMTATINYSGLLIEPNMKIAIYRRNYNDIYLLDYINADLKNYVTNNLESFGTDTNIYNLFDTLSDTNTITFNFKPDLMSGTYKLEFKLYDGNTYVGNVIRYVIIK